MFFNSEYGRINVYDIYMQYRVSQKQLDPWLFLYCFFFTL